MRLSALLRRGLQNLDNVAARVGLLRFGTIVMQKLNDPELDRGLLRLCMRYASAPAAAAR